MNSPINDPLASQINPEYQLKIAHIIQDAFAQTFRQTLELNEEQRHNGVAASCRKLLDECNSNGNSPSLLHAMVTSGLDQWGIAYSQAFGTEATIGVTELLTALKYALSRDGLETECQAALKKLYTSEESAFTFKAELHKGIQLALWHAMIAAENRDGALQILKLSGGRILGLINALPQRGWIIVSNTLADVQIRCLAHGLAKEGLALEMTQELLGVLNQLTETLRKKILLHANQSVIAWHQSRHQPH